MLTSIPVCLAAGCACGLLSAFGIGGGSLLVIWLAAVAGMEQRTAQCVNLLFFLPTAAAALVIHSKNQMVLWRAAWPAMAGGAVTAALFSWIGSQLDTDLLRKLFGGFLLIIGALELCKKSGKGEKKR